MNDQINPAVIFFGGSFEPFHHGHAALAERLIKEFPSCRKLYLCVMRNRLKDPPMFEMHYRVSLIREWIRSYEERVPNNVYRITDISTQKDSLADTLIEFKRLFDAYQNKRPAVVIGDDCLESLTRWFEFDKELMSGKYDFIIVQRDRDIGIIKDYLHLFKNVHVQVLKRENKRLLGAPSMSSTEIRHTIKEKLLKNLKIK